MTVGLAKSTRGDMAPKRRFNDIVSNLIGGDSPEEEERSPDTDDAEDEDNRQAPEDSAPNGESPESTDKPESDPTDDAEPEEQGEPDPEADADEEVSAEPEDTEGEPGDDSETPSEDETEPEDEPSLEDELDLPEGYEVNEEGRLVFRQGDEEIPADELAKGYLRQSDYTRKTQQLSELRDQTEQALEDRKKLVRQINKHDDMREFVQENPDAWEYLLDRPKETRSLMQNSEQLEAFRQDYQILKDSPKLAEAYARADDEGSQEEIAEVRERKALAEFSVELDQAVSAIAEHEQFADHVSEEDVREVKDYVMELGGFTEESEPEEIRAGLRRLWNVFVTPDGENLDMKLVLDKFDTIKSQAEREQEREEREVEEHNKQVEEELEEQEERPPATPEGDGAAPQPEKGKEYESFNDVLSSLRGD